MSDYVNYEFKLRKKLETCKKFFEKKMPIPFYNIKKSKLGIIDLFFFVSYWL